MTDRTNAEIAAVLIAWQAQDRTMTAEERIAELVAQGFVDPVVTEPEYEIQQNAVYSEMMQ